MQRQHKQHKYAAKPLLQRLSAQKETNSSSMPQNYIAIDALYEDIRQNLEFLLNTRVRYIYQAMDLPELDNSLFAYGLQDFMHSSYGIKAMQKQLCAEIKKTVDYFEPRISNPQVHLHNMDDDISRVLKIRIEGSVKTLEETIPAVFESSMDLNKHNFNFE